MIENILSNLSMILCSVLIFIIIYDLEKQRTLHVKFLRSKKLVHEFMDFKDHELARKKLGEL